LRRYLPLVRKHLLGLRSLPAGSPLTWGAWPLIAEKRETVVNTTDSHDQVQKAAQTVP
jgi:hypothetical protein